MVRISIAPTVIAGWQLPPIDADPGGVVCVDWPVGITDAVIERVATYFAQMISAQTALPLGRRCIVSDLAYRRGIVTRALGGPTVATYVRANAASNREREAVLATLAQRGIPAAQRVETLTQVQRRLIALELAVSVAPVVVVSLADITPYRASAFFAVLDTYLAQGLSVIESTPPSLCQGAPLRCAHPGAIHAAVRFAGIGPVPR